MEIEHVEWNKINNVIYRKRIYVSCELEREKLFIIIQE